MYAWPPFLSGLPDLDLLEVSRDCMGRGAIRGHQLKRSIGHLLTIPRRGTQMIQSLHLAHILVRRMPPMVLSARIMGLALEPSRALPFRRAGQDAFADTGMLPNNNAPHSSSLHRARVPQEMRGDHLRLSQAGEMGQPRRDMRVSQVHDVASGNQSWDQAEATGIIAVPCTFTREASRHQSIVLYPAPRSGSTEDGEDDEGEEEDSTFLYASLRRQDIHESTSQPLP
ncbi:hypothetical protein BU15DRAFT_67928 [Melanogaster broomeanus]|nr:hypothetical protein BU15DRAFT_67928 [Melanogaster broomeanus]